MGAEFPYEDLKARSETALIMSGTGKSELLCQECYRASDWSFQRTLGMYSLAAPVTSA